MASFSAVVTVDVTFAVVALSFAFSALASVVALLLLVVVHLSFTSGFPLGFAVALVVLRRVVVVVALADC